MHPESGGQIPETWGKKCGFFTRQETQRQGMRQKQRETNKMRKMHTRAHIQIHTARQETTPTEKQMQRPRGRWRERPLLLKVTEDRSAQWLGPEAFIRRHESSPDLR